MNVVSFPRERAARGQAAPSTVEALMLAFRKQGLAALDDRENKGRLAELSIRQTEEIVVRLNALRHTNPLITDELLARLIKIGRLT